MKKILTALAVLSVLTAAGCDTDGVGAGNGKIMKVVCLDGYAFAVASGGYGVSTAQIWENGPNGPQPMMCGQMGERP